MAKKGEAELLRLMDENPFPNDQIDPKKKETAEFGVRVGNAIMAKQEYFNSLNNRWKRIEENRNYGSNQQNPDQYKSYLDPDIDNGGDASYLNLNWAPSTPAAKFVDVIIGGIINNEYKIQCNAIDDLARVKNEEARDEYYGRMIRQRMVAQLEQSVGVKLEKEDQFVPKNEEDLDIYMEMTFKQAKELAMEQIIEAVFKTNDWEQIEKRVVRDLVENNKGVVRFYFDENNNIRCRYTDIGTFINTYTDDPNYADTNYEAEYYMMTIQELRNRANGHLTEEALFYIAKSVGGRFRNPRWKYANVYTTNYNSSYWSYDDYRVPVLDFIFYTTDTIKAISKKTAYGGEYFDMKPYNFNPPKKEGKKKYIEKYREASYEGLWIVDSNYIVGYGKSQNITRPIEKGKLTPKLFRKYVIFEPNLRNGHSTSILERFKPNIDRIQLHQLHMQNIMANSIPKGIAIDIQALQNVTFDKGGKGISIKQLLKLYSQKGVLVYDGKTYDGLQRAPFQELMNGMGDGLTPHIQAIEWEVQQIRDITGINEARDGSEPSKDSLVGLQKLALLASNNATRELYDAYALGIFQKSARLISRMVQDKVKFTGGLNEFENMVSPQAVRELEWNEFSLSELGIFVEAAPDEEDVQNLIGFMQRALDTQEIRLEDAMEIMDIPNVKQAIGYLKHRKKVYSAEKMQERQMEEQMIAQREIQASQAKLQADTQILGMELKKDLSLAQAEHEFRMIEKNMDAQGKLVNTQVEGQLKSQHIVLAAQANFESTELSKAQPQPRTASSPIRAASRTGQ